MLIERRAAARFRIRDGNADAWLKLLPVFPCQRGPFRRLRGGLGAAVAFASRHAAR